MAYLNNMKFTTYTVADSPATWNKDPKTQIVTVYINAGGGGGGSGRKGLNTAGGGGGGGAGGGGIYCTQPASVFGNSETIIIGAGGTGGASQSTNSTNGNPGNDGEDSSVGSLLIQGGTGGDAGVSTITAAATAINSRSTFATSSGIPGGIGRNIAGSAPTLLPVIPNSQLSGGGGGGGGGCNTATERSGGTGNPLNDPNTLPIIAASAGGLESTGINGVDGSPGLTTGGIFSAGTGGGGGGGYSVGAGGATTGGKGGNGGFFSAGGGGGGGGLDGVADSGAGGDGADGQVIVIEFF